jgi:hypothetical protein
MSKYILPRKRVDEMVIEWEKMHDKNEQTESLTMFIARKQAEYLLKEFIDNGFAPEVAKTELQKILSK